jgi:hypothetical protein
VKRSLKHDRARKIDHIHICSPWNRRGEKRVM